MDKLPPSGRPAARLRRQLSAVLTAAFIVFQQVIVFAPAASAQTRRATALDKTAVKRAPAKSPAKKLSAPTLDEPGAPNAPSSTVVISQVYGGGGATTGSPTYKNDYVELFNLSSSSVVLTGYSLQYGASAGNFGSSASNIYAFPSGTTIAAGKYLLVQLGSAGTVGGNLPVTPDLTTTNINMSAASGKIALANTTTALGCGATATPCTLPHSNIVDLVAYGASNNGEGGTTVNNGTALTNTQGGVRKLAGCQDTDNNNNDFNVVTNPVPRNSATPANPCGGSATPALAINDVSQDEGNSGQTAFTFTVSLSTATHGGVTFNIATADGTAQDGNPAGEDTDYQANSANAVTIPNGSQSAQFTVQVNGDTTSEPNETFFVNVTSVTGATVTDGQGQGTIVNDDIAVSLISQVQGSGAASPVVGSTVSVRGIVTLLKSNGFFLQEETGDNDADPNTSEGIFVFTSSTPTVNVADQATVTGSVVEFNGLTEITGPTVSVNSTGNALPTAVTIDATILSPTAPADQSHLEKYEGMRMAAAALRSVSPNDNFFDIETVLPPVPRQQVFREPGIPSGNAVPPDPTSGTPDPNIPIWDRNPEKINLDTNGRAGATGVGYTSNVTFSNVAGPLDYTFGRYRLVLEAGFTASPNISAAPAPTPTAGEFTVVGYNIENFNNDATQRQKAADTIRNILHYPDIIGAVEIFDLADLQALRDEINNDAVAAGDPNPQYEAYLVEQDGASEDNDQDVGYLVKTSRVSVTSVTAERTTDTFINPNTGNPETAHDRPPFVLRATVDPSGANPQPVITVVNHLRSFIDIELVTGEGARVRAKRKAQAESLAGLLQELQTNNPGVPVISVGDYNAFQFNNGYDDPVSVLKGNPTPDDQIVVDQSPDLVNPDFSNLIDLLPADTKYTFFFDDDGAMQVLDHVLVNTAARARNTRIAIAHINADFPEVPAATFASNAARVERNSDHDPVISYFSLGAPQTQGSLIISEFRFRGPAGALDEFVELYNDTDSDITVSTLDGSPGWAVAAADGATRFIVPNGTVIPARRNYLGVNSSGYTLVDYADKDTVLRADGSTLADGYTQDIPDGSGVALFSTANPANFTLANRLDAAGYAAADALYREGAGFPGGGGETTNDLEHSFVRKLCAFVPGVGCSTPGTPKDTDDNLTDFVVVNTTGQSTALGARLGAPGPESSFSPEHSRQVGVALLDPSVSASQAPNRARDFTSDEMNNSTFGTLAIRRTLTNNTGGPVSFLTFRIVEFTTYPAPPGTADLRALDSSDMQVMINGSPVDVRGTYVEQPPTQPEGGGLNSSLGVGYINLEGNTLADGDSISVQFLLGVQQTGTFRFYITVELRQGEPPVPAAPKAKKLIQVQTQRPEPRTRARGRR